MYARVTKYKMKQDHTDAARALLDQLRDRIMGQPGITEFINVMNEDGSGFVIAVLESREVADANRETVAQLWGAFADHLESPPQLDGGDVIAHWTT